MAERPAETDSEPIHTAVGQIYTTENRDVQPSPTMPSTEEIATGEEVAIAGTQRASYASTLKTPSQRSVSVARSSTRSGRFGNLLAHGNTLLSWLSSASRQPSEDGNRTTPRPPPVATPAASPAQSTPRVGSPPTSPTERTAYQLAKQLRNF
ncbi:hypothetical protein DM02DRAFT_124776 [Periconia macrospinosa]|uniref:Uncharacterized protein n=1 Tax=Periconia macrospinosa TaxID=97972 RepID=A0A2V1DDX6_9PLEO|nr:hypothetical protein DM02DRAFT_124776 [Periconia macrospinosa]